MIPFGPTVDLQISVTGKFVSLNFSVTLVNPSSSGTDFSISLTVSVSLDELCGHITVNCYRV